MQHVCSTHRRKRSGRRSRSPPDCGGPLVTPPPTRPRSPRPRPLARGADGVCHGRPATAVRPSPPAASASGATDGAKRTGGATAWATAPGAAARGGCSGVPSYTGAARWRAPRISNSRASRIAPASGRAGTGVRALGRQRDHLMSPPTAAENSFTRSSALTFFLPASRSRSCSVRSASRVPDTLH